MSARSFFVLLTLASAATCGGQDISAWGMSREEERIAVAQLLPELRRRGELEDMKKYGLITNREPDIRASELLQACWRLTLEHPPLGVRPNEWGTTPPPDLTGTNEPGGVSEFVRTHGWNMHTQSVMFGYGFTKTQPIKALPWKEIRHREFQAVTANGILYVVLGSFHNSSHGVAYNPNTNRIGSRIMGFCPIGAHWYAWREPEDPMTLPQLYEGGAGPVGQQDGPANGSQPIRSETNTTPPAAGSRR